LTNLTHFQVHNNQLTGTIPDVSSPSALVPLELSRGRGELVAVSGILTREISLMLRSALIFFLALMSLIAPLGAQAPAGWEVRVDRSQSASDPDNVPDLKVMTMGKGFHVQGGPAGTFWNPANRVTGNYTVKATFNLMKPSGHTNYYGLIFGGQALEGAGQKYVYFLVAQDGTFIIRARSGEKVDDVQRSTANAAVRKPGADGRSTNNLEVRVGNNIQYVVNGTVVHTTPKSGVTAATDGFAGVRINHVLDVHVDAFEVQRQ